MPLTIRIHYPNHNTLTNNCPIEDALITGQYDFDKIRRTNTYISSMLDEVDRMIPNKLCVITKPRT